MSDYSVSILITVLFTTLLAFYYLYKSKDLNMGIFISISAGAVILGVTFYPVYRLLLTFLRGTLNIDRKVEIAASIVLVILTFLIMILSMSFIISVSLPAKFCSIDCCVVIDRFVGKVRKGGKAGYSQDDDGRINDKKKKPVDTTQIIDTMGIEKSGIENDSAYLDINGENYRENSLNTFSGDKLENGGTYIIAEEEAGESDSDSTESDIGESLCEESADCELEYAESIIENVTYMETALCESEVLEDIPEAEALEETEDLVPEAEASQEIVDVEPEAAETIETAMDDISAEEAGESDSDSTELVIGESLYEESADCGLESAESIIENVTYMETALCESEVLEDIPEAKALEETEDLVPEAEASQEIVDVEPEAAETAETAMDDIPAEEADQINCEAAESAVEENASGYILNKGELLVLKAFDCKVKGHKEQAIKYYTKALNYNDLNSETVFWTVLDICTLYKQLGLNDLALSILNGVSERFGDAIRPKIRAEINNNLKIK